MSNGDRQLVLTTIRDLGSKVTVADVVTHSGLPVPNVHRLLNAIAAEEGGWLEVTQTGEIAYCFGDICAEEAQTRLRNRLLTAVQVIGGLCKRILRMLILTGLLASIGCVLLMCWIAVVYFFAVTVETNEYNQRELQKLMREPLGPLFKHIGARLEHFAGNCNRFILGPGTANSDLVQRHWHLIADTIRAHHGTLVYEQLAPFSIGKFNFAREDAVMPVLIRFNGEPKVSKTGSIIYIFPDLEVTSSHAQHHSDRYLKEREHKFFDMKPEDYWPVMIMFAINVLALHMVSWAMVTAQSLFIWHAAMSFALALFVVPILRCFGVLCFNGWVDVRNSRRRSYLKILEHPSKDLLVKLVEAKEFAMHEHRIGGEAVVYSTAKDILEQQFEQLETPEPRPQS